MAELKPCPFCGGKGYVHSSGNYWSKEYFKVVCPKNCCMQSKYYETEEEAIDAWNRRCKSE